MRQKLRLMVKIWHWSDGGIPRCFPVYTVKFFSSRKDQKMNFETIPEVLPVSKFLFWSFRLENFFSGHIISQLRQYRAQIDVYELKKIFFFNLISWVWDRFGHLKYWFAFLVCRNDILYDLRLIIFRTGFLNSELKILSLTGLRKENGRDIEGKWLAQQMKINMCNWGY